ncbi:peptidoglycan D,D-transpeptidase FtsI family protein [Pseudactinotalea sp. Z1748]|uniref:peptidoglycan D,D-transpeptidase FtsI family protein n=1 Tax=Pseudactinotalea sp. Z1748 TaxID=3413027 RepID=UPI003C7DDA67
MNTPLRRLSVVVLVMFLALMGGATWVQYGQAGDLNDDPRNVRTVYRDYGRDRGPIVVAGNEVAHSTPVDTPFGFQRVYSDGPLYAHATGYFSMFQMTGIERASSSVLSGTDDSLLWSRIRSLFTGSQQQGGSVELTLDPAAQEAARDALGDQQGAVVALDPRTGAILAMVSTPSFDPNDLAVHSSAQVNETYNELVADEANPLINRAIGGGLYAPGSVFKLVDAAMLLESGEYDPDSQVPAPAELELPQTSHVIRNPGGGPCTAEDTVTLTYALQQSCNTPFSALAMEFGEDALAEQAEAFGFGRDLDIPMGVTPSRFPDGMDQAQLAMSAIGQYDVRVSPLQMAMVSAAIANDGVLMTPHLIGTERGPNLQVTSSTEPEEFSRPISASTAADLREMMLSVVESGTGTPAQIPNVAVAGKTGTAESGTDAPQHAWFTAFAPAQNPQVAVAVVIEHGGADGDEAYGGRSAGPIARAVIQAVVEQ